MVTTSVSLCGSKVEKRDDKVFAAVMKGCRCSADSKVASFCSHNIELIFRLSVIVEVVRKRN